MSYTLRVVLLGTALLGGVSGVVGAFAVLRRRALAGDVLAHAALPGICLAFLAMDWLHQRGLAAQGGLSFWPMLAGALATGLLASGAMTLILRGTRTKDDAAIGIVLSTFFGAGAVLVTRIQRGEHSSPAGIEGYLYGQAALLSRGDLAGIVTVSAAVLAVVALFYKEFRLTSFDPEFAQAQGWPTTRIDLLLMGLIAVTTVAGLPAVGVVLMAALLITPAAAARFWCDRLTPMLALSGALGAFSGVAGTLLSQANWGPPGPLIVLVAAALFVGSLLVSPRRGVLALAYRRWQLRRAFEEHHLLRALYELGEPQAADRPSIAWADAARAQRWSKSRLRGASSRAARRGLIERAAEGLRLTPQGLRQAEAITRSHRLWELYWLRRDPDDWRKADRAADALEHLLSPDQATELAGEWIPSGVPPSPHELPAPEAPRDAEGRR